MKQPSMVSKRLMPAANRTGERQDRVEGQATDDSCPGQNQERDLGRRVEPKAEEKADRVHLPRRIDPSGQGAEKSHHQTPVVQLSLELFVVIGAGAHLPEHSQDAHQNHDVEERGDEEQEERRDRRAHDVRGRAASSELLFLT